MNELIESLRNIIELTRSIEAELSKEEPSLDSIEKNMADRADFVTSLEKEELPIHASDLSEADRLAVSKLFNDLSELEQYIQQRMENMLTIQHQHIQRASQHRKAEDSYKRLNNF